MIHKLPAPQALVAVLAIGRAAVRAPSAQTTTPAAAEAAVTGTAVPGMPLGSPGMEGLGRAEPYEVIAFGPNGADNVFASR